MKKKTLVPLIVFLLGMCLVGLIVYKTDAIEKEQKRTTAQLNATAYGERIKNEITNGIEITDTLQQILISENGEINYFDTISKNIIDFMGGKIDVYSEKGKGSAFVVTVPLKTAKEDRRRTERTTYQEYDFSGKRVLLVEDNEINIEITRNIAERFNGIYGNVFKIPDGFIPKNGARVMSLQDPTRKMSKSDENVNGCVHLLDAPEVIMKKFKRAVTDSEAKVRYAEGKDGVNNLMAIYSAVTGLSYEQIEKDFDGKGYGDFKTAVGEAVVEELRPIRERYEKLVADKAYLESCYRKADEIALKISSRTMGKVMKKIGFI